MGVPKQRLWCVIWRASTAVNSHNYIYDLIIQKKETQTIRHARREAGTRPRSPIFFEISKSQKKIRARIRARLTNNEADCRDLTSLCTSDYALFNALPLESNCVRAVQVVPKAVECLSRGYRVQLQVGPALYN